MLIDRRMIPPAQRRRTAPCLRALLILVLALAGAGLARAEQFTPATLAALYEQVAPSICVMTFTQEVTGPRTGEPRRQEGHAIALIVSADGLLISNGHLQLENVHSFNFRVRVQQDGQEQEYPAVLLEKPDDINISLLRIQADAPLALPAVQFRRDSRLRLGEEVALIGVMGETMDFERALLVDRIAAVIEEPRRTYCLANALRFGFVAGPVMNVRGEVVGVTGFDLSRAEGGDMYARSGHPLVFQAGLFIGYIDMPPDAVKTQLRAEEAWLGVFSQPLKEEFAEYWGLPEPGGLIVSTVVAGSPADDAGLKPGDIIRAFDGHPIRAIHDREVMAFTRLVRESEPHKIIEIEFLRDGAPEVVLVTLGVRPRSARDAEEYTAEPFGLVVREITRDLRILLNLGEEVNGVIVRRVISGSPAHLARMQPGVIIMTFGDYPVSNLADFERAVRLVEEEQPAEVSVFARVGPATGFFRLRPRW